ncbi:MAG: phosphatidylserine decarboxylase family protein [Desulfobacteraceae bacterium]
MSFLNRPVNSYLPVAFPGLKFIAAAGMITGIFFYTGVQWAAIICLLITVFVCWFFRDPERIFNGPENALISPADGRIIHAEKVDKGEYVESDMFKVSIFMNVFNVHVNRVPFPGTVREIRYTPGKFVNASFDKASEHNERNAVAVKTENGTVYKVVQVAGLIARRIVWTIREGDTLRKGDRYGMIRFGSRLDLYLPMDTEIKVSVGQKVKAGLSVIGLMNENTGIDARNDQSPRTG